LKPVRAIFLVRVLTIVQFHNYVILNCLLVILQKMQLSNTSSDLHSGSFVCMVAYFFVWFSVCFFCFYFFAVVVIAQFSYSFEKNVISARRWVGTAGKIRECQNKL